jgi:hypothetical protein
VLLESHCLDQRLILANGESVPVAQIDPRLNDVALFQFYRHDEVTPGDHSNWFAPNTRAVEQSLASAGFEPELLANWSSRVAFRGTRREGPPEYQRTTL